MKTKEEKLLDIDIDNLKVKFDEVKNSFLTAVIISITFLVAFCNAFIMYLIHPKNNGLKLVSISLFILVLVAYFSIFNPYLKDVQKIGKILTEKYKEKRKLIK